MDNEFKLHLNQKGYIIVKDHDVCEAEILGFIGGELVVNSVFTGITTIPPCDFFERKQEAYDKAVWLIKGELERCASETTKWKIKLDAAKKVYGLSTEREQQNNG